MPHIETIQTGFFRHKARATNQITGIPKINYEHFIRGIYSGQTLISLLTQIGPPSSVFISTFGAGSKDKAVQTATASMQSITSLLPGIEIVDNEITTIEVKDNCAILHILGIPHIGYKAQGNELIRGLSTLGSNITVVLNAYPVLLAQNANHDTREKYLLNDTSFMVSYSFFMTEKEPDELESKMKALIALLGSVYDSEHSEIQVQIETGNKAIKSLQKLLWGELYYATIVTTRELEAILQIPETYGIETINTPELYVPVFSQTNQGIPIGTVVGRIGEELYPAYLDPKTIFQHMAIWGAIGFGKSTLVKNIIVGLHNNHGIHTLIFDMHNEYREIIGTLHGELGQDILIFNPFIKTFALNPLQIPPDVAGKEKDIVTVEVAENFISMLIQIWTLGEVQEQRCRTHLYELYEQSSNPTVSQLIALLETDKLTKIKKDEDNLPSKMGKFVFGFYGEIFNKPNTTLPFDKIANATTIFELSTLPIELRTFFVTVFLSQWWNFRRVQKLEELPPHVLILDEFHHYDNMPIPRKILSEGRKYKQGVICSHQGPHQITDQALLGELIRNTVTKVTFKTLYQKDIEIILASLGLWDRQMAEYLPKLELGEAIVTLYEVPQPFKIITNAFPKPDILITDEQVREISESLIDAQPTVIEIRPQQPVIENNTDKDDEEFLRLLYEKPHSSANDIIREMRIMRSKGWDIKNNLVVRGLIIEETIRAGKGRPKKILKLTDEGYSLLGVEKEGLPAHYGKEEHLQIIKNAADILTGDGWNVTVEEGADIKAEKENKRIAVEIETCKAFNQEQIIQNIAKNLKWADKVVIISPNLQTTAKIRKLAMGQGFEKVTFLTYEQITEHLISKMDRNFTQNDVIQRLRDVILNLDDGSGANIEEIIAEMAGHGISEQKVRMFIHKLKENGTIIEVHSGVFRLNSQ